MCNSISRLGRDMKIANLIFGQREQHEGNFPDNFINSRQNIVYTPRSNNVAVHKTMSEKINRAA